MEVTVRTPKGSSSLRTGSGTTADSVVEQIARMQELNKKPLIPKTKNVKPDPDYSGAMWMLFSEYGEVPIPGDQLIHHGIFNMRRVGHDQEDHESIRLKLNEEEARDD